MKTAELTGAVLDWAVAHCENLLLETEQFNVFAPLQPGQSKFQPSSDWSIGGPIIERENIVPYEDPNWLGGRYGTPRYLASKDLHAEEGRYWSTLTGSDPAELAGDYTQSGGTYLIAAMRCYVASKLGADVELPEELK